MPTKKMNTFGYTQFSFSTESLTMPMQWYLSGKGSSLVIAMKNNWTMLKTHSQFQSIYHSAITLYKHITVAHWLLSIHTSLPSFLYQTNFIRPHPVDRWTVGQTKSPQYLQAHCTRHIDHNEAWPNRSWVFFLHFQPTKRRYLKPCIFEVKGGTWLGDNNKIVGY